MKWKLYILLMFVMIPIVLATHEVDCQTSQDNLTWVNVTSTLYGGCIDETSNLGYIQNIDENSNHYIRCRNSSTNWAYAGQRTDTGGEIPMASLAIVIFILTIIVALFILPFKVRMAKSNILDGVLKRCCWILALWLLSLSTAMVATIADNAGIELTQELFRFMWLINWGAYLFMFYVFFSFFLDVVQEVRERSKMKRCGGEDDN